MATEFRRMGPTEVRITKVYTVEAGEFSAKHDVTPNWRENRATPGGTSTFALRIEAEAGRGLGGGGVGAATYDLYIYPVCLTNPPAVQGFFTNLTPIPLINTAFDLAGAEWEYEANQEKYTKTWSFPLPDPRLGSFALVAFANFQVPQVYQYIVVLMDNAATKTFASFAVSEPFLLIP